MGILRAPVSVTGFRSIQNAAMFFMCSIWCISVTCLISSLFQAEHISDLLNKEFLPLWRLPLLHYKVLDLNLRLTKLDHRGCPSSSFSVRLAPCLLPLPHCSWGSHSLATASRVPQAPYPRRAPASPSEAPLSLRAQPLPTIPPQVGFIYLLGNESIYCIAATLLLFFVVHIKVLLLIKPLTNVVASNA